MDAGCRVNPPTSACLRHVEKNFEKVSKSSETGDLKCLSLVIQKWHLNEKEEQTVCCSWKVVLKVLKMISLQISYSPRKKKSLACLNPTLMQRTVWWMMCTFHLFPLFFLRAFFHYTAHSFIPKHFPNSQLLQTLTQQIIWTLAIFKHLLSLLKGSFLPLYLLKT